MASTHPSSTGATIDAYVTMPVWQDGTTLPVTSYDGSVVKSRPSLEKIKTAGAVAIGRSEPGYSATKDDASPVNRPNLLRCQIGQIYDDNKVRNMHPRRKRLVFDAHQLRKLQSRQPAPFKLIQQLLAALLGRLDPPQHILFQNHFIRRGRIHRSHYATTLMTSLNSGTPRDAYKSPKVPGNQKTAATVAPSSVSYLSLGNRGQD